MALEKVKKLGLSSNEKEGINVIERGFLKFQIPRATEVRTFGTVGRGGFGFRVLQEVASEAAIRLIGISLAEKYRAFEGIPILMRDIHFEEKLDEKLDFAVKDFEEKERIGAPVLYVNLWIEDDKEKPLIPGGWLIKGRTYSFLFAIERWPRQQSRSSRPFEEPSDLKKAEKTEVEIEVVCPLLEVEDQAGHIRRKATYYSGVGLSPQSFPLKPRWIGRYDLTARLRFRGQTIYREVLVIEVVRPEEELVPFSVFREIT
jgi:hypothetical protein